jgi:hypothetical protein
MSKIPLPSFALLAVLFFAYASANNAIQPKQTTPESQPARRSLSPAVALAKAGDEGGTGTLQKMIVENASVTMQLDLNGLSGSNSLVARPVMLHFAAAPNSFFPILVFNDLLRGLEPGSMNLALQDSSSAGVIPLPQGYGGQAAPGYNLPAALRTSLKRLTLEKVRSGNGFDLAIRDSDTGFAFFNIEGHQYNYDAVAQSLTITGGRLLVSQRFANTMGIPSKAGSLVGTISIGAAMQPIQIDHFVNGETKSMVMPAVRHAVTPGLPNDVHGPDVIVGDIEDVDQMGNNATQVGLAIGTDSCNNGDQPVDWFALPNTDHPVVPQNLYRMSGGANNDERFEQIGQSWMKHTFEALEDFVCGNCNTSGCQTGTHLCPGCSDPYVSGLNGDQDLIGSRAWINPFTGSFPPNANDHSGHVHDGVSHRILVDMTDLNTQQNVGATYFGEAAYISPHEYTWCQSHPGECNMFNNFSHRQFSVSGGPTFFTFSAVNSTVRMQPAMQAWAAAGATVQQVEPDAGNDGIFFVGYRVTGPNAGMWHYEYAIFNMNLDRAVQSFQVVYPFFPPTLNNVEFHAPPQHPGWAHDGTQGDAGYSSAPWSVTKAFDSITWSTETFAQNQNANAIRWGTLYNFRFDSSAGPATSTANIGFFKTGAPVTVEIQAPSQSDATPTPTATATATPTGCSVSSPLCGRVVTQPSSSFILDATGPVDPATLDASDFTVNGIPANSFTLSNGNTTIIFFFNTSPAAHASNIMHIAAGAFNCGNGPVLEFTCGFRYIPTRPLPTPAPRP